MNAMLRLAIDKFRAQRNAKCALAWDDLRTKTCIHAADAAKKNGVTKHQFARWIAMHQKGELGPMRVKLGLPRHGRTEKPRA